MSLRKQCPAATFAGISVDFEDAFPVRLLKKSNIGKKGIFYIPKLTLMLCRPDKGNTFTKQGSQIYTSIREIGNIITKISNHT